MTTTKTEQRNQRQAALLALKRAIVEGDTSRYEHLVAAATAAGATDEEIDLMAHQAVQALLTGAEEPITSRELAYPRRGFTEED